MIQEDIALADIHWRHSMADIHWPDHDPIGQYVYLEYRWKRWIRTIGVESVVAGDLVGTARLLAWDHYQIGSWNILTLDGCDDSDDFMSRVMSLTASMSHQQYEESAVLPSARSDCLDDASGLESPIATEILESMVCVKAMILCNSVQSTTMTSLPLNRRHAAGGIEIF